MSRPQATPLLTALHRGAGTGPGSRALWLCFLLSMLAFHAYPVSDLVHRGYPTAAVVAVLVAQVLLAGGWVRTMWLATATVVGARRLALPLVVTCLLGIGLALALGGNFKGLLIYVSIGCAFALPMRWVVPAVGAAAGLGLAAEFRNPQYLLIAPGDRLNEIVGGESLIFFLGLGMFLARRTMLLIIELRAARADLAELSVTQERLRFARDLHDLLGHSLTTIALKAQLARRLAPPNSPVARELGDIETVTAQALVEVRDAVTGYRSGGVAAELDAARSLLAAGGVQLTVRAEGPPLPAAADGVLVWVVRETVTNILRHAAAGHADLVVSNLGGQVTLRIRDDGTGARAGNGWGNGLTGLSERLAGVGGRLVAGPDPAGRFQVLATIPAAIPATMPRAGAGPPGPAAANGPTGTPPELASR